MKRRRKKWLSFKTWVVIITVVAILGCVQKTKDAEQTVDTDASVENEEELREYEEAEASEPVEPTETQEPEEDSHEVSDGAQMVLSMIAEDMAKQVAQNPGTVKMSIFSQGFYKDGHTYVVQSDFTCSNLMGVKESHTIKVIAVSNEDESKISPTEVYLDGELIWVRDK